MDYVTTLNLYVNHVFSKEDVYVSKHSLPWVAHALNLMCLRHEIFYAFGCRRQIKQEDFCAFAMKSKISKA